MPRLFFLRGCGVLFVLMLIVLHYLKIMYMNNTYMGLKEYNRIKESLKNIEK